MFKSIKSISNPYFFNEILRVSRVKIIPAVRRVIFKSSLKNILKSESKNRLKIKHELKNRLKYIIYIIPLFIIIFYILLAQVSCCFCFDLKSEAQTSEQEAIPETTSEISTPLIKPDLGIVSILRVPGQAIDVKAMGGYAYLTNDLGTLFVVDVKDKENPKIVGKCTGISSANIVMLQGNYAYVSYTDWISPDETGGSVTDSEQESVEILSICGFKIIDIKDKQNPKIVGDFISGSNENRFVQGLVIDGDYAYLNSTKLYLDSDESRLEIIDIKDKSNPKLLGFCSIEGQPNGLFVQGEYAYLNNVYFDFKTKDYTGKSSFIIVDIKNREKPVVIGTCEVPGNSWSVYAKNNFSYLSSNVFDEETEKYINSKLQIVDISNPLKPLPEGSCSIAGGAWEMDMKDNFVLISSLEGGVSAVDISDSQNPEVVSIIKTGGNSYDIAISGDYGYIADGFEGLVIIELQKKKPQENLIIEDTGKEEEAEKANRAPVANLNIFGDRTLQDLYSVNNPIYFSALGSFDPEGADLNYTWTINGEEIIDLQPSVNFSLQSSEGCSKDYILSENKDEMACFFDESGKYNVKLTVSDGVYKDSEEIAVNVENPDIVIEPLKEHNFNVVMECLLINKSSVKLKNIECYIRTPQNYYPFQIVNKITPSIATVDEIFDDDWNLLTHFKFDKALVIGKGEEFKASITTDVTMYEYDFKRLETKGQDYELGDEDLKEYTKEDLFIDCKNPVIIDAAKKAVGGETDPLKKAKKIYDYVARKLYYDFPRAADKNYKLMDASEILKVGKGVCADYSILYIALLRASGIPARFVGGIPVTLILGQKNSQLDVGHAWVEIKLPRYGWIPIDITQEEGFMDTDYFLNLATEKGENYLYGSLTMDPNRYYFDGFRYKWDGMVTPNVEQSVVYRIKDLSIKDIETIN